MPDSSHTTVIQRQYEHASQKGVFGRLTRVHAAAIAVETRAIRVRQGRCLLPATPVVALSARAIAPPHQCARCIIDRLGIGDLTAGCGVDTCLVYGYVIDSLKDVNLYQSRQRSIAW